ncbi:MAG: arylsulfatase [Prolixibacteraceae bacterium]|jgi:arylsulfatase A|nr:arylsulfatase [Prolixibacteraceae bacterium]MBT6764228.1 arylsulfatase [Prolixibacteraceae bacterium]MBT6997138.1 arylsulfatase [Prolixibacteraceae bacterium]MBT7393329.1 arylsulfatase [Prolixibacteraceae bacterium]
MKPTLFLLTIVFFVFSACQNQTKKTNALNETKPNIIYILADDLGYGDLSFQGQTKFQTPHIDQLAKEGMTFTQHYSGSTVCSPSRSVLLTGQHTGHTPIRGNKRDVFGNWPIPAESLTVAEILKENGYVTGAFGKWGLGCPGSEGDPNNQGFDEFFGYNDQTLAHNYYPAFLNHNQDTVLLEDNAGTGEGTYAPIPIHNQAIKFMEDNKNKPFFMYYPSVIPHAELFAPEKYMEKYRGNFLPEKSYDGHDEGSPRYKIGGYGSQSESHAAFAAMVDLLDVQVGEIVAKVKELGIENNTIIMFSSDNGPHLEGGADPDYFDSNGIYKGYKRDLYEGGIHAPMIIWWPGKVKAESTSDHISAFWDVLPTITNLIGAPTSDNIDGISFLPSLLGEKEQPQHEYLYWEFHEKRGRLAIRQGDWKLIRYDVFVPENTTTELYNLIDDPGEENNIAGENPEITAKLLKLLESARTDSDVFTFGK